MTTQSEALAMARQAEPIPLPILRREAERHGLILAEKEAAVWMQSDHLQKAQQEVHLCRCCAEQLHPDFVPLYRAAREKA